MDKFNSSASVLGGGMSIGAGILASAQACGKVILFGEHAVVYQQPAIAIPLKAIHAQAVVHRAARGTGFRIYLPQVEREFHFLHPEEGTENGLVHTARLILSKFNLPEPDMTVTLTSTIPQKSGFGSGAAVSTAIGRALCTALGKSLARAELNKIVYDVEKMHHGTPSGIDNTVIVYERPIFFIKGEPIEFITQLPKPLNFLVASVEHSTPTKVTVSDVRFLYEKYPRRVGKMFNRIGEITRIARQHIEAGDIEPLGTLMNENHRLLRRLTVSDDVLDKLCRSSVKAGALGAKLSGGGRGGNIIALVNEPQLDAVREAMLKNGAVRVFHTILS